jgi:hypothetical protein
LRYELFRRGAALKHSEVIKMAGATAVGCKVIGSAVRLRLWLVLAVTLAASGCSKDPVDRCIDARLAAFDEKYPDGVSRLGKTRAEVERDASFACLYVSGQSR